MTTAADRLLADGPDPGDRIRQAVTAARGLDPGPRAALLADLAGRGAYERRLAVTMAVATRDGRHLAAAVRDPFPSVRAAALAAVDPSVLADVLLDGPLTDRGRAAARLRRGGHEPVTDAVLPQARARWGDAEAAALLAGCSAPVVAAQLPELGYAVAGWAALAARHADAVVAHAESELATLPAEGRVRWWTTSGRIVGALLTPRPADVLRLAEQTLTGPLPSALLDGVHRLLAVDASRVLRLVLDDPARVQQLARARLGRSARTRLGTLPDADLGRLLRAAGPSWLLVTVLRTLPPSRREAVYDLAHTGRDRSAEILADEELALLPHRRRHAEARRILALPMVVDSGPTTRRISAFLPFPEARPLLDAATRSPDADERGDAYSRLVSGAAATGDPAVLTDVLGGLDRIPNEQDPVRVRVLGAVAQVRPALIEEAALPALDALVTGAVDARDASPTSRSALHRIVFGLVGESPPVAAWALSTMDRLGAWRYGAVLGPALRTLPRGREHAVFARLRSRLEDALRRGEADTLIAVAQALGRRAWAIPELQDMIGRATRIPDDAVIARAVDVWLAPPATRLARAEELVAGDPSTVTLRPVTDVLTRKRPARLLALAGRRLKGRRGTGGSWWLPTLPPSDLRTWTPAQVDTYMALLRRAVDDEGLPRATRAFVVRTLATLDPATSLVDHPDVLLAEAALTGLGRGDRPYEAMRTLLRHLDSDRARVALYAAARCAREIPPAWLTDLLTDEPASKVTARKELARWQGRFRPPGALDALLAAWHRPGEHRDVRLAVLAALRSWLGDERVWAVLDEAGRGDRHLAGAVVAVPPTSIAPGLRPRYGVLVRSLASHPDDEVARSALLALAVWIRWAPEARQELTAALVELTTTATWRCAATAVLTDSVWTAQPELLPDVVAALVRGDAGPDAERLRDRPARQRVLNLVAGLCGHAAVARRHPGPVLRVADLLAADPTTLAAAARLRAVVIWPGATFVADLGVLAALVADRPLVETEAAAYLESRNWDPDAVGPAVDALAGGHLAVALTATAGASAGWTEQWRARLRTLRTHPDPDVRAAALAVTTAPE